MPEECNRIATDHLSTLLFCPNEHSARQLTKEGLLSHDEKPSLERPAVYIPGDVMYDNSLHYASELNESYSIQGIDLRHNDFMLASCHRPANVDEASKLTAILDALEIIASEIAPVILPIHPRLKKHQSILDKYNNSPIFSLINPVSYKEMIQLESRCKAIITDSGGLQKEAFFFKKPCVVLRENTEWEELKQNGNVLLCGNESSRIIAGTKDMISRKLTFPSFYGQGNSAEKICELIVSFASC